MIKKIFNSLYGIYVRKNSKNFVSYLRKQGIDVGGGTFIHPKDTIIDITRPSLVSIGCNCYINRHFTLLTHDYVSHVFVNSGKRFINSSGSVTIGNNVSFGINVMVLKGVVIGDNCFIGANSLVTNSIPPNSIAVGIPAKVVCSIDDYYKKRIAVCESEAFEYANSIVRRFKRRPVPEDFWEEFPLFISGNEVEKYPMIPIRRQLGPTYNDYVSNHVAKYKSFEAFLNAAGI